MTDDFTALAIEAGLQKLLTDYFDICKFDALCKLARLTVPAHHHERLAVLHCVNYKSMNPELHKAVVEQVTGFFRFCLPVRAPVEVEPPRTSFMHRLFAGEPKGTT